MATAETLRALIAKKDEMEKEVTNTRKFLDDLRVGMTGPLIDAEGYPRSDIDLYAVRNARQRVNCLTNDLRAVMKEIEEQLYILHGSGNSKDGAASSNGQANGHSQPQPVSDEPMGLGNAEQEAPHRTSNDPFLTVDDVLAGSPAANAGLKDGDFVIQFGSLCKDNFGNMQQLADITRNSVGRPIRLTVLRDLHPVRLSLMPKQWGGQGLLGCKMVPYRG